MLGDQGQMSPGEGRSNLCPHPRVHAVTSSVHAQCRSWAVDRASALLEMDRSASKCRQGVILSPVYLVMVIHYRLDLAGFVFQAILPCPSWIP